MRRVSVKKKLTYIALTVFLILNFDLDYREIQGNTSENIEFSVEFALDPIWNGTGANKVVVSSNYLYIIKDGNIIIMLENEEIMGSFECNGSILGITAINSTIIVIYANIIQGGIEFPDGRNIWTLSFKNATLPIIVSNTSIYGDVGAMSLSSYNQYVYLPFYEFGGFYILDYTNISEPLISGTFAISWHALEVDIVADCGLFMGDTATGVYYMADNPKNPRELWKREKLHGGWPFLSSLGIFGVSDRFVAYFTTDNSQNIALVIPRINKTHVGETFEVNVDREYITSGIIDENILVALKSKNSINLWEIKEENKYIEKISTIEFTELNTIKFLHWIEKTNDFYLVDEEKGIYRLSIEVERNLITDRPTKGFFLMDTIIIITSVVIVNKFKKTRRI